STTGAGKIPVGPRCRAAPTYRRRRPPGLRLTRRRRMCTHARKDGPRRRHAAARNPEPRYGQEMPDEQAAHTLDAARHRRPRTRTSVSTLQALASGVMRLRTRLWRCSPPKRLPPCSRFLNPGCASAPPRVRCPAPSSASTCASAPATLSRSSAPDTAPPPPGALAAQRRNEPTEEQMAYAERLARTWRARFKKPDGTWASKSGFDTKEAALHWAEEQEAEVRRRTWISPEDSEVAF